MKATRMVVKALVGIGAALLFTCVGAAQGASASTPWWGVMTTFAPTHVPPGGEDSVAVVATNLGDAPVAGEPVTIVDHLPKNVQATEASLFASSFPFGGEFDLGPYYCSVVSGSEVTCSYPAEEFPFQPYGHLEMVVRVSVGKNAVSGETNEAVIEGGKTARMTALEPMKVSSEPTPFGIERNYALSPEEEGGALDERAGSHPFQLTTTASLNQSADPETPPALSKNLSFNLPAGLIGDAQAVEQCTDEEFATEVGITNKCPASSVVGVAVVRLNFIGKKGRIGQQEVVSSAAVPVFNMTPAPGEPARFGLLVETVPVILRTAVRSGRDYSVMVSVHDISVGTVLLSSQVSFWGVPSDPRHNTSRGWGCLDGIGACEALPEGRGRPLLTLPTTCESPFASLVEGESWGAPDRAVETAAPTEFTLAATLGGCAGLSFEPQLSITPEQDGSNTPTGVKVGVHMPQEANEDVSGVDAADIRKTVVALPSGLQINAAAAAGLAGCTERQIAFERFDAETKQVIFEEETEQERLGETPHKECPEASKLGKVTVTTPLLSEPLTGWVYQAAQNANPFNSLLALYVVAEAPKRGVRVRLAGEVKVEPDGQLVSAFDHTPQLPFENFTLEFFGGDKAPLATTGCGAYRTESTIQPWSGTPAVHPFSEFDVTSGPGGTPCSSVGGFAPSFVAGTQNNAAASFSPFVLNLTRKDGEQVFRTVALTMPLGLAGDVSKVTLCPEAQANLGTCAASSQIGHVRVSAGVGKEPIVLPEAGKPEDPVYMTGPYKGAPFGLAVVVPAEAGPFNLDEGGHPIVVRAKLEINPYNAQVTVLSDPQPTRLQGIPLDVRDIEVVVDKPGFMFNPTSCNPTAVNGTIGAAEGARANVTSRFQAADCASLPFRPSFSALTSATHTRFGGDSLHVVVKSAQGQANLREVHVELPKVLPSRLSTLNLACPEATFAANPAACPAGSRVGVVTAQTPILSVPITGPAYFVSHGGAKFPELIFVLQGEGVTVQLNGETFISSKGITSSTFKTLPDVPVSRVDVVLPAGKDSVLTGIGDLCKHPLYMPTTLTGQNGAVIKERTRIAVAGCKPELIVLRRHVKGATATIVVKTPSAGWLVASGRAISRAVRRLGKAGVATLMLTLTKTERKLLARHQGRKLKVRVALRFTPRRGHVLTRSVTVLIG